jgi:hypothetical protein
MHNQCEKREAHFGKEIHPSTHRDRDGDDKQDDFRHGWKRPLLAARQEIGDAWIEGALFLDLKCKNYAISVVLLEPAFGGQRIPWCDRGDRRGGWYLRKSRPFPLSRLLKKPRLPVDLLEPPIVSLEVCEHLGVTVGVYVEPHHFP